MEYTSADEVAVCKASIGKQIRRKQHVQFDKLYGLHTSLPKT